MRGAGTDGTALFDQYHRWVNLESMLEKCFVGYLVPDGYDPKTQGPPKRPTHLGSGLGSTLALPAGAPIAKDLSGSLPKGGVDDAEPQQINVAPEPSMPTRDWFQSETHVTVTFYTRGERLSDDLVLATQEDKQIKIEFPFKSKQYQLSFFPRHDCSLIGVAVKASTVSVQLLKTMPSIKWAQFGEIISEKLSPISATATVTVSGSRVCKIKAILTLSHNAKLFILENEFRHAFPIGHHIDISMRGDAGSVMRPYTPIVGLNQESNEKEGLLLVLFEFRLRFVSLFDSSTSIVPTHIVQRFAFLSSCTSMVPCRSYCREPQSGQRSLARTWHNLSTLRV
jgi:cytochrome-b5 reductase